MSFFVVLLLLVVQGLVIGALGRLAIPGPNPMSIPSTIAVGLGGSLVGGLLGYYVFGREWALLLGVLAAALIVWFLQRNRMATR